MGKKVLIALIIIFSTMAFAQKKRASAPANVSHTSYWTWDLGAAMGTYSTYSYSEIDLGINYHFAEIFNWRNVLWSRFGSSAISTTGLDSSIRYEYSDRSESGKSGYQIFAGPGVRIASTQYSGYFFEAGAAFLLGGLNLGGGVKAINYSSPGKDPTTNQNLPNTDTSYFIILSGSGGF